MTILFWSTAATAFKLSLAHIGFVLLVFYASFASMLALGLLCIFRRKISQLSCWQARDYGRSLILGMLNPGLYYIVLFRAYELLPAQQAQVLNFTWPIVLTLLGVLFLKQRLSISGVLAMVLSFLGVVIVATRGDVLGMQFSSRAGVMLALSSTLIWASYWLINQADAKDPLLRLWVNFIAGVVCLAIYISLTGQWALPGPKAALGAVYIGLFEMSLAFFCWFQALRFSGNVSLLNNLIFLTPFGSLLVIALVLQEAILPSTMLGLALISGSIIFQRWKDRGVIEA